MFIQDDDQFNRNLDLKKQFFKLETVTSLTGEEIESLVANFFLPPVMKKLFKSRLPFKHKDTTCSRPKNTAV